MWSVFSHRLLQVCLRVFFNIQRKTKEVIEQMKVCLACDVLQRSSFHIFQVCTAFCFWPKQMMQLLSVTAHNRAKPPQQMMQLFCAIARHRAKQHPKMYPQGPGTVNVKGSVHSTLPKACADLARTQVQIDRGASCPWQRRARHVWVVKSVSDMVRSTGLQRLIFKSDQEPSILEWLLNWMVRMM